VTIYLYGTPPAEGIHFQPPFAFLGHIGLEECNALYNRCTVGLCLSCTNPSRVPFEMMASGLPVVDLWRENTLYDFPEDAICLAGQTPEDLALAVLHLLNNHVLRKEMRRAGLAYMQNRTEQMESDTLETVISNWLESGQFPAARDIRALYSKPPVAANSQREE
jgi:glycosyltransferase involved in cell wall biosynthesis